MPIIYTLKPDNPCELAFSRKKRGYRSERFGVQEVTGEVTQLYFPAAVSTCVYFDVGSSYV